MKGVTPYFIVVAGEPQSGKTFFALEAIKKSQIDNLKMPLNNEDILIYMFANENYIENNYSYFLFNLFVELRKWTGIKQKISFAPEYFRVMLPFWINMSCDYLKKCKDSKTNIILLLDGIEKIGDESQLTWLQEKYPDNFKVVITVNTKTPQYTALKKKGAYIIKTKAFNQSEISTNFLKHMFNSNVPQYLLNIKKELLTPNYITTIAPIFINTSNGMPTETNIGKNNFQTADQIIEFYLSYCEEKFTKRGSYRKLCAFLAVAEIGFTADDISVLCELDYELVQLFLKIFDFAFLKIKDITDDYHYCILHSKVRNAFYKYCSTNLNNLHLTVCKKYKSFSKTNLLSYWEFINHLYKAKKWTHLKDTISKIEQFIFLYKPDCQYKLFICWNKMIANGYDPVTEYNNELENFLRGCLFQFKDLFYILLQLSRFFYDLKDLETKSTPEFRHPPLKSTISCKKELDSITLLRLLKFPVLQKDMITVKSSIELKYEEHIDLKNPKNKEKVYNMLLDDIKEHKNIFKEGKKSNKILYFFKRWVWIQFGWLCADITQNYSKFFLHVIEYPYPSLNFITYKSEIQLFRITKKIIFMMKENSKSECNKTKEDSEELEYSMEERNESIEFSSLKDTHVSSSQDDSNNSDSKLLDLSKHNRKFTSDEKKEKISVNCISITSGKIPSDKYIEMEPPFAFSTHIRSGSAEPRMQFLTNQKNLERISKFDKIECIADGFQVSVKKYEYNLNKEISDIVGELDSFKLKIEELTRKKEVLLKKLMSMTSDEKRKHREMKHKEQLKNAKINSTKAQIVKEEQIKSRLEKIVVILNKNRSKNKDWIEALQTGADNYSIMKKYLKELIFKTKAEEIFLIRQQKEMENLHDVNQKHNINIFDETEKARKKAIQNTEFIEQNHQFIQTKFELEEQAFPPVMVERVPTRRSPSPRNKQNRVSQEDMDLIEKMDKIMEICHIRQTGNVLELVEILKRKEEVEQQKLNLTNQVNSQKELLLQCKQTFEKLEQSRKVIASSKAKEVVTEVDELKCVIKTKEATLRKEERAVDKLSIAYSTLISYILRLITLSGKNYTVTDEPSAIEALNKLISDGNSIKQHVEETLLTNNNHKELHDQIIFRKKKRIILNQCKQESRESITRGSIHRNNSNEQRSLDNSSHEIGFERLSIKAVSEMHKPQKKNDDTKKSVSIFTARAKTPRKLIDEKMTLKLKLLANNLFPHSKY